MSILQFLRIFVARWLTIVIATVSAALGAYVVAELVQPRYEATGRIMLNLSRPDPVTGQSINLRGAGPYIDTQRELITDYRVTGRLVDKLGWLTDPGLIRAYQARPAADTRDFRRWLAERVANNTEVAQVGGSTLHIKYRAPTSEEAKIGAETLREGYLEESLLERQSYARKNAAWYNERAKIARDAAEQAELAKAAYEKESGIILTDGNADLDSARLAALAGQLGTPTAGPVASGTSSASMVLAQLDAEIAESGQRLGPNHPRMVELRKRRDMTARVATQEEAAIRAASSGQSSAEAIGRVLQAQKNRVISQRDKVERLRQLQAEVDLRRDEYKRTAARAAELSLESGVVDTSATALGVVVAPRSPAFPNKLLMVGGATALGFALGLALSLLLELLNRRVRGIEDLDIDERILCIGVVEEPAARTRNALRRFVRGLLPFRTRAAA